MQTIVITGNIASGKSTVGQLIAAQNLPVLDTDNVVNQLYQTKDLKDLLQERFGYQVFTHDGAINKKQLATLIFTQPDTKRWLESLIWPRVMDNVNLWLFAQAQQGFGQAFILVPMLFEAGWQDQFDQIWLVTAPETELLTRLQVRDHLDLVTAKQRLKAQMPDKDKQPAVDVIIRNRGTLDELKTTVHRLLKKL